MINRVVFLITLVVLYISFAPVAVPAQEGVSSNFTKKPNLVKAGRYRLDPVCSKITWSIDHMGFSTFYGHFTQVFGDLIIDPSNMEKTFIAIRIETNIINALHGEIKDR